MAEVTACVTGHGTLFSLGCVSRRGWWSAGLLGHGVVGAHVLVCVLYLVPLRSPMFSFFLFYLLFDPLPFLPHRRVFPWRGGGAADCVSAGQLLAQLWLDSGSVFSTSAHPALSSSVLNCCK